MIEISTKRRISQKPQRLNKITITSMNLLKLNYLDFSKKIIKVSAGKIQNEWINDQSPTYKNPE